MPEPPLLREFMELRRQGLSLGVRDYLTLLEAMDRGYGVYSRKSLLYTCETLWGKSRAEQIRVNQLLDHMLPTVYEPSEAIAELAALPSERSLLDRVKRFFSRDCATQTPKVGAAAVDTETRTSIGAAPSAEPPYVSVEVAVDLRGVGEPPPWRSRGNFELEPRQPIPSRLMRQIWRGYRRAGRVGPKVEIDVGAAIDQVVRKGVLLDPPMRALRVNQAKLLLLVDQGDSMAPFTYITRALIRAAQSTGMRRLDVRYFLDVPREQVYRDPGLNEEQPLDRAVTSFVDQGVMIFSDAGATKVDLDEERVEATAQAISILLDVTPTVAWLNPVPRRRWRGSSAEAIVLRTRVPMFPFNKTGLRSAISALHGKHA